MPNKIKYGISNCFYAKATLANDGTATYATPVALPGAVNLSLDPDGDMVTFYADNIKYWTAETNNGYEGTLELALVPDAFKQDILGWKLDSKNFLLEDPDAQGAHFALICQFNGDTKNRRVVFYNCVAKRPSENGATKEASISPQTETLNIEIGSIYNSSLSINLVKAVTTEDVADADFNSLTSTVYQPTALHT